MEGKVFAGQRLVLLGLSGAEKSQLKKILTFNGGNIDYMLTDKTSFLVAARSDVENRVAPVLEANKRGIPVVSKDFVFESIAAGKLLDPKSFVPAPSNVSNSSENASNSYKLDNNDNLDNNSRNNNGNFENDDKASKEKKQRARTAVPAGGKWRTARVFISSTFKDMHGERDYLTRVVFPELQERCNRLRVHIHPVDLRWGVTSDETSNALELCLTELDSCRPFFLGLLGERYGWVPETYKFPDEPQFQWLKSHPSGRSITHLEMEYGALLPQYSNSRAAFYLRDPSFLQNVPEGLKSDFVYSSSETNLHDKLIELKSTIKQSNHVVFEDYPCSWKGIFDSKPMVGELDKFGQHVLDTLWSFLQAEFPAEKVEEDPLTIEREYHQQFMESHSQTFMGREQLLSSIERFVDSQVLKPVTIVGLPGSGKTSLVSYFANSFSKRFKNDDKTIVIPHFIGAAPDSTDIRQTLLRLIQEISYLFDIELENLSNNFSDLVSTFKELIEKVRTLESKRLVLILDALNQLDNTNQAHTLEWLPIEFPPNVRVIISTLDGDVRDVLQKRGNDELIVGSLSRAEQEEIVTKTLWQYRKKLDKTQMEKLLKKTDASKPLFLVVACEELRVFGVYELVTEKIEKMAETVPTLFEEVLRRLEGDTNKELFVAFVTLLAASRGGLLEAEMMSLIGLVNYQSQSAFSKTDLGSNKFDSSAKLFGHASYEALAQSTWSTLYRSLRPYLRPPGESGEGVLDFFHQQLPKAVKRLYFTDKTAEVVAHRRLAHYFWTLSDPEHDGLWSVMNKRALNYAPYHQIKGELWSDLNFSLGNLGFIESKCTVGMTFGLVADYLQLGDNSKKIGAGKLLDDLSEFQRFVTGHSHVLSRNPALTFSLAYAFPNDSAPFTQAHARYYTSGLETRPFIKWTNKPQFSNPNLMTLKGHDSIVNYCCYSHAAKNNNSNSENNVRIVAAADEGTLKIYDAKSGEELRTLKGHTNNVTSCTFSRDGKYVFSGGLDRKVIAFDAQTGQVVQEWAGAGKLSSIAVFPGPGRENTFASVGTDKNVSIWRIGSTVPVTFQAHEKKINTICVSPNGLYIATGSEDKTLKVFDATTHQLKFEFNEHTRPIIHASISSDSRFIVTASEDRSVKLWDLEAKPPACIRTLLGHKDGVTSAVISHNNKWILSASHDNVIQLWDFECGEALAGLTGHTGTVFHAEFSHDDKHIVSCSFDRSVKVWEVREKVENVGHEARILAAAFSPGGKYLATGSRDKTAKIWDSASGRELFQLKGHTSNVNGVCFSPDGKRVCSGSRDGTLRIWLTDSGKCEKVLEGHKEAVRGCAWSPDGRFILSASDDKTLIIWDAKPENGYKQVGALFGHRAPVVGCIFSPDGHRAASCSDDGTVKLWDTRKNSMQYGSSFVKVATLIAHESGVRCVAFSPDSSLLISGGEDANIIIWNAKNAKIVAELKGHSEEIRGVAFTDDGRYTLSGASDSTFHMWNTSTYEITCSFACSGRLCACDSTTLSMQRLFAVGDGSGSLYILTPIGLLDQSK